MTIWLVICKGPSHLVGNIQNALTELMKDCKPIKNPTIEARPINAQITFL
jgi:hypothetical protein